MRHNAASHRNFVRTSLLGVRRWRKHLTPPIAHPSLVALLGILVSAASFLPASSVFARSAGSSSTSVNTRLRKVTLAAGAGDFNGDDSADVIWLHSLTGQVVIWLMNGTSLSSAATVTTVANTNWKIAGVGDVNNDGKSDVFWRNSATGETVVWLMNGTSINSSAYLTTVSDLNYNIVGVGDFNGDGMTDVFWRNGSTGQNVVWLMNGASTARRPPGRS
jgi:hypothetical protein